MYVRCPGALHAYPPALCEHIRQGILAFVITYAYVLRYFHFYILHYLHFNTIDLTATFSQTTYSGLEDSGVISVTLLLEGGTSSSDISLTVTPSDQSPVSAQGKEYAYHFVWLVSAG